LLDRPESGERSLLLHIGLGRPCYPDEIEEFRALAVSAGAILTAEVTTKRQRPHPRFLIGSGKVEQLREQIQRDQIELVLVNRALTPSQERNLEQALKTRVLDRNGLILDIFAQRAQSFEGKLQVELAQLQHLSTRLIRGWTHLERQKGGIGLRGPGETQLETDRRLVGHRIKRLRSRLASVDAQREQGRRTRRRAGLSTVALVGYTNAGKSSLFNAVTGSAVGAKDQLFATLDPTVRRVCLQGAGPVLLVDTVGFVRDLPHELVAAFRATLTETREASLLVHVVDASDPHHQDRQRQVEQVLEEIGAGQVPRIQAFNKIDILGRPPGLEADASGRPARIWVSAANGAGLDLLRAAIAEHCAGERFRGRVRLAACQSRMRAQLFALNAVRAEEFDERGGWVLDLDVSADRFRKLCADEGVAPELEQTT
jgi:GTP-binding protein HflX